MMTSIELRVRVALFTVMTAFSALYTAESFEFGLLARYTPLVAGACATCVFAALTIRELVRLHRTRRVPAGGEVAYGRTIEAQDTRAVTADSLRRGFFYAAIIVTFVAATWLVGLRITGPVFVAMFMLIDRRTSNRTAVLATIGVIAALYLLSLVGLAWPVGILTGT